MELYWETTKKSKCVIANYLHLPSTIQFCHNSLVWIYAAYPNNDVYALLHYINNKSFIKRKYLLTEIWNNSEKYFKNYKSLCNVKWSVHAAEQKCWQIGS